jgi:hypothetical protein
MRTVAISSIALSLLVSACSWQQWGKDLGSGLMGELVESADTVGSNLVRGVRDTLTGPETTRALDTLLDTLGTTLAVQAAGVRDSLVGVHTMQRLQALRDSLLGARMQAQMAALREEILGLRTRELLGSLRTELLGDSSRMLVDALRGELLGEKTTAELVALIDKAMYQLALRFRTDVRPELEKELTFIQKNSILLMVLLGALGCGVVAFIFWQKRRLVRLVQTLTFQIHEIPDQRSYDELVHRIQRNAQQAKLEPFLRKILREQGILGGEAWHPASKAPI